MQRSAQFKQLRVWRNIGTSSKYEWPTQVHPPSDTTRERDVVIVGAGHNGLVAAAYLAKHGFDVSVLERRHLVGGAAVTEELVPGFKFSRASYLAGLFRPQIIEELHLEQHGFKYLPRDPSSFTPTLPDGPLGGKHLLLGGDADATWHSIAQFSRRDADAFFEYEEFLGRVREIVSPLLDMAPPSVSADSSLRDVLATLRDARTVVGAASGNSQALVPMYELFTAPAAHILDRWFESDILKTTLATDAVIGAMVSPRDAGSGYVLLHHVMGEAAGKKGVWAYVQGGMGALSDAIARSAQTNGAEICVNAPVRSITHAGGRATGVQLTDGTMIRAKNVLSNCTPYHTFLELLSSDNDAALPSSFTRHIRSADYSCGAFKINCALDRLPEFACCPSPSDGSAGPQHRGTVHFESSMQEIDDASREAKMGIPATRPVIEMTLPSSLDSTISPEGQHVCQLFVQFIPYNLHPGEGSWQDEALKESMADRVFDIVEQFAPGFTSSVVGRDVLSPLDLERVFGLQEGNIMHGALALHQLGYARPAPGYASYRTPLQGLYLCGAGAHPGGGVMGAAGRNCAMRLLSDTVPSLRS